MNSSLASIAPRAMDRIAVTAEQLRRELPAGLAAEYCGRYAAALPVWDSVNTSEDIHEKLRPLEKEVSGKFGAAVLPKFSRLVVASLALTLGERVGARRLPQSVLELYPLALEHLVAELEGAATADYFVGNENFVKDVRFAAGLMITTGAVAVDLRAGMTVGSLLKCLTRRESTGGALGLLVRGRWKPWFQQHIDSRYVEEVNGPGFDRSYHRIADLLDLHPEVHGIFGTSWVHDPALEAISPRLAFFNHTVQRGAILLRHGPGEIHTLRATQTSPTRRKLVEEGKYTPICYSMVWPRESLIRWARQGA